LLAQGRRGHAADALAGSEPERLMTRIAYGISAARVHADVAIARRAVELASGTDALNLHADACATLGELLA
jgi:hypothetical protein